VGGGVGHKSAIKAVAFLNQQLVVSASKDTTLRTWKVSSSSSKAKSQSSPSQSLTTGTVFRGHNDSVECLAVNPNSKQLVSGGWDKKIILWNLPLDLDLKEEEKEKKEKEKEDSSKDSKKRKADQDEQKKKMIIKSPTAFLDGHSQCVSALCWATESGRSVYSAGWDYTVRQWDVQSQSPIMSWNAQSVVSSLSFSLLSNLIATTHHDSFLRIWDPRHKEKEVLKLALRSHKGWVSSCAWSRWESWQVCSGAYDGNLKLWDIRSTTPLQTVRVHEDKLLALQFLTRDALVSGGADRMLRVTQR